MSVRLIQLINKVGDEVGLYYINNPGLSDEAAEDLIKKVVNECAEDDDIEDLLESIDDILDKTGIHRVYCDMVQVEQCL